MLQIMTRASTTTDSRHSITVQVLKVSPTSSPKYSLMSQKPASLTWERNTEPAPMAITSRAMAGVVTPICSTTGPRMPAVVMMATVAEPVATRTKAAISQASRKMGMEELSTNLPMMSPMPVSTSTPL